WLVAVLGFGQTGHGNGKGAWQWQPRAGDYWLWCHWSDHSAGSPAGGLQGHDLYKRSYAFCALLPRHWILYTGFPACDDAVCFWFCAAVGNDGALYLPPFPVLPGCGW